MNFRVASAPLSDHAHHPFQLLRQHGNRAKTPVLISVIYPSHVKVPLKLRTFLDFSIPRLRERLGYKSS